MNTHTPRSTTILVGFVALSLLAGCAGGDPTNDRPTRPSTSPDGGTVITPGPAPDQLGDGGFSSVPRRIETRLQYLATRAGEPNWITCEVFDDMDQIIVDARARVAISPRESVERTDEGYVATKAGSYTARCELPSINLRDESPEMWQVVPGPAAAISTTIDPESIPAGDRLAVTCLAEDAFGNEADSEDATVNFDPAPSNIVMEDRRHYFVQSAGTYRVACALPGAVSTGFADLEVRAGLPAILQAGVNPMRAVYAIGETVQVITAVADGYGNPVMAGPVEVTVEPAADDLGDNQFRLAQAGRYTVTVEVTGRTDGNRQLREEIELLADEGGPEIICGSPGFGAQVITPENGRLNLSGQVSDTAGVASVTVNGEPVALRDGNFAVGVRTRPGLNVHEIVATDVNGEDSGTFCAFYVADAYLDDSRPLEDAIAVRLGPDALDDGDGQRPIQSFGDILRTAFNSQGVADYVHAAAAARNPIVPTECRVSVGIGCAFSVGLVYHGLWFNGRSAGEIDTEELMPMGEQEARLSFVEGGLRLEVTVRNVVLRGQLDGTLDNFGTVTTDRVTVTAYFGITRSETGEIEVALDRIEDVSFDDIDWDFSGVITGTLLEAFGWVAENFFRGTIIETMTELLDEQMRSALEGLFANLTLNEIMGEFEVPGLTGDSTTALGVSTRFSAVDFNRNGAVIGLGVAVDAEVAGARRSRGYPIAPGPLPAPEVTNQASGVVDLSVVNMILHRLWRAGYFDNQIEGVANRFAAGGNVSLELTFPMAPAIIGDPANVGGLMVFLGPAEGRIRFPGLIDELTHVRMAGAVSVPVELNDAMEISFGDAISLEQFHFSLDNQPVGFDDRSVLENLFRDIIQRVISSTLASALPSFPLPQFRAPATLSAFGVPEGTPFGLRGIQLTNDSRAWQASGGFGE